MKMPALTQLYANSVLSGQRTIDQVPAIFKADVQKLIDEKKD